MVWQFGDVEFLECAGFDLALQEGAGGHNHVIAGGPSQQFRLKHFVAVEDVVDQVDACFCFELLKQGFVDIIRPVVNADFFRGGSSGRQAECEHWQCVRYLHLVLPLDDTAVLNGIWVLASDSVLFRRLT